MFPILLKKNEIMSSRHRSSDSHSKTPSGNDKDVNNNPYENNSVVNSESPQGETCVEPKTNPTENTQQNSLQIQESSSFEKLTGQIQNTSVEMQQ